MTTPWIVLATIIGYFILLFVVSWLASRKSDANTALTGGREAPWFLAWWQPRVLVICRWCWASPWAIS